MMIGKEVICNTCERVFCCSECREKHEQSAHINPVLGLVEKPHTSSVNCPICEGKPLRLQQSMNLDLLKHVNDDHLPLKCNKCFHVYTKIADLLEFNYCTPIKSDCSLSEAKLDDVATESAKSPQKTSTTVSTQTSPTVPQKYLNPNFNHNSTINLCLKISNFSPNFISDSTSAIKNASPIINCSENKSLEIAILASRDKVGRKTSTPLQAEICVKTKEHAFDGSGSHVSSISNLASEPDYSPATWLSAGTPSKNLFKYNHKPQFRSKLAVAATPLRQVMSKSIQKAIAAHGIVSNAPTRDIYGKTTQAPSERHQDTSDKDGPLDLRLSPALRRTQSDIVSNGNRVGFSKHLPLMTPPIGQSKVLLPAEKETKESVIITSTSRTTELGSLKIDNQSGSSLYQTCRSVEIITSNTRRFDDQFINRNTLNKLKNNMITPTDPGQQHATPHLPNPGIINNKKLIAFETPPSEDQYKTFESSSEGSFHTPSSTPIRNITNSSDSSESGIWSFQQRFVNSTQEESQKLSDNPLHKDSTNKATACAKAKKPIDSKPKLWSFVSSVIGLSSFIEKDQSIKPATPDAPLRKCQTYAGTVFREDAFGEPTKRKRNLIADYPFLDNSQSNPKRSRIQGRKPIQRMRHLEREQTANS